MRVVVVGAGVLGAATARALVRFGAEVTIVDAHGPGSGTSSRGAGLVSEAMWHPVSQRLVARSMELLLEMSREGEELGHPFRYHSTGSTTLLAPQHVPQARALAQAQRREGAHVEEVAAEDLRALPRHEHMRVDDVALALHYPRDGWALPQLYAGVATYGAQMAGARVVRGEARLRREPLGVEVDGERFEADAIVVACGVWTRRLLQQVGLDAPLLAYRTQALRYAEPRAELVPILHDAVQGFYLRPGIPQHLVAGDGTTTTPEDVAAWKAEGDDAFVASTLRRLHHRFPYLPADAKVDAWAGIEAATPDRLLLAGPHPGDGRIWLLAGGNGHGFMRAPAAGEALAARIMGARGAVDVSAFSPERFGDLSADFVIREGFSLDVAPTHEAALK